MNGWKGYAALLHILAAMVDEWFGLGILRFIYNMVVTWIRCWRWSPRCV